MNQAGLVRQSSSGICSGDRQQQPWQPAGASQNCNESRAVSSGSTPPGSAILYPLLPSETILAVGAWEQQGRGSWGEDFGGPETHMGAAGG